MAIFMAKNTLLRKSAGRWQEQNGISFQVRFGILRTGVIKKNFCLNLPEMGDKPASKCNYDKNGIFPRSQPVPG
jgi:hypothetical protein